MKRLYAFLYGLYWDGLQVWFRVLLSLLYRARCEGRDCMPATGGALLLSNHQSYLDPLFLGIGSNRYLSYLARQELFKVPLLGHAIVSLRAIPIDRNGMGLSGIKETLRQLKREQVVIMFPEGTRTLDGEVRPIKPGFVTLARRAKVPLVPAAVDGAWQAWPKSRKFPGLGVVQVEYGAPIMPAEFDRYSDVELVAEIERRMRECLAIARWKRNQRLGRPGAAAFEDDEVDAEQDIKLANGTAAK